MKPNKEIKGPDQLFKQCMDRQKELKWFMLSRLFNWRKMLLFGWGRNATKTFDFYIRKENEILQSIIWVIAHTNLILYRIGFRYN